MQNTKKIFYRNEGKRPESVISHSTAVVLTPMLVLGLEGTQRTLTVANVVHAMHDKYMTRNYGPVELVVQYSSC